MPAINSERTKLLKLYESGEPDAVKFFEENPDWMRLGNRRQTALSILAKHGDEEASSMLTWIRHQASENHIKNGSNVKKGPKPLTAKQRAQLEASTKFPAKGGRPRKYTTRGTFLAAYTSRETRRNTGTSATNNEFLTNVVDDEEILPDAAKSEKSGNQMDLDDGHPYKIDFSATSRSSFRSVPQRQLRFASRDHAASEYRSTDQGYQAHEHAGYPTAHGESHDSYSIREATAPSRSQEKDTSELQAQQSTTTSLAENKNLQILELAMIDVDDRERIAMARPKDPMASTFKFEPLDQVVIDISDSETTPPPGVVTGKHDSRQQELGPRQSDRGEPPRTPPVADRINLKSLRFRLERSRAELGSNKAARALDKINLETALHSFEMSRTEKDSKIQRHVLDDRTETQLKLEVATADLRYFDKKIELVDQQLSWVRQDNAINDDSPGIKICKTLVSKAWCDAQKAIFDLVIAFESNESMERPSNPDEDS